MSTVNHHQSFHETVSSRFIEGGRSEPRTGTGSGILDKISRSYIRIVCKSAFLNSYDEVFQESNYDAYSLMWITHYNLLSGHKSLRRRKWIFLFTRIPDAAGILWDQLEERRLENQINQDNGRN